MSTTEKRRETYAEWGNEIARNWERKDISSNIAAFSQCHKYLESPFSENAAATPNGISTLWNEVLSQNQISIEVNLIAVEGDCAVFSYRASFSEGNSPHRSSGIWVVEFEGSRCVSFKQWFNVE